MGERGIGAKRAGSLREGALREGGIAGGMPPRLADRLVDVAYFTSGQ